MSWTSSPSITEISKALVAALGMIRDVPKSHEARVPMKSGGSFAYRYADLADVVALVRPHLHSVGLAVSQTASSQDVDTVLISTTIWHSSGEWIMFAPLGLPAGRTAQETGSAITYGRRYTLLAALGLAAEDDDAATAAPRPAPRPAPARDFRDPFDDRNDEGSATGATIEPIRPKPTYSSSGERLASAKQISFVKALAKGKGLSPEETLIAARNILETDDVSLDALTFDQAKALIEDWKQP